MVFIPTYLYIKQHTITGKLYFGKCTRPLNEMLKYTGSGSRWKKHYQKHGRQYIITLWYELYDNPFDLVADALSMSKSFDIVNNNSWMNLMTENGLDGVPYGNILSKETILKMKFAQTGCKSHRYGKKNSPETRLRIKKSKQGVPQSKESNLKRKETLKSKPTNPKCYEALEMYRVPSNLYNFTFPNNVTILNICMVDFCNFFNINYNSARHIFRKKGVYKKILRTEPENIDTNPSIE